MMRKYVHERLSWIFLVLVLQLLLLFVAAIDRTIPFMPMLYIVFLSLLVFGAFLLIRYPKETRFYQNLATWDDTYDLNTITAPESPLQSVVMERLNEQTDKFRSETSQLVAQLEEEKDELMSWIHEVKTPLTAMRLMIDRMGDEPLKEQLRLEWLRIHLLLDRQLHQKRIPFIENDLYIEQVKLEPLLHHEIRELRAWCLQKGIGFDLNFSVQEVLTDAKWLAFIVRQLLTNAVKYSEAADINVESGISPDGQAWMYVRDRGRGIETKDLTRIFEKGFTSTRNHEDHAATGMGLYLAKKAADSLSIRMSVESSPGEGTVFTLHFPKSNAYIHTLGM
ncbi:sensor histidine kinase [Paenibacillus sp. MBLB2552]|uniref:histidine kinase n=1 Tax=Paenibacillus mellifer TaxID=2937794 RepID=A0A9X1Y2G4_9BACL|nr:sensor histidine kinase [Paenibacillus mellifer]MCK8489358.1 sensor histidine kinase [Paenibacillus mellifer]